MSERSTFLALAPHEAIRRLVKPDCFSEEDRRAAVACFLHGVSRKAPTYNFPKLGEQARSFHHSYLDELFRRQTIWAESCSLKKAEASSLHALVVYTVGDSETREFLLGAIDNKGRAFTMSIHFQTDVRPLVVVEATREMVDRQEDFFLEGFLGDDRIHPSSVIHGLTNYFRRVSDTRRERTRDAEDDFRRALELCRALEYSDPR